MSSRPRGTAPRASGTPPRESSFLCLQPVGNYPTAIFSPNGNRVLTAGENSRCVALGRPDRNESPECRAATGYAWAGFSPDGRSFATARKHASFSIWNAEDGALIRESGLTLRPYSLTFSPDGSRLLVGAWGTISYGDTSSLWDVSKGTEIARLAGHKSDTQLQRRDVQSRRPPDCNGIARWQRPALGRKVGKSCMTCSARSLRV